MFSRSGRPMWLSLALALVLTVNLAEAAAAAAAKCPKQTQHECPGDMYCEPNSKTCFPYGTPARIGAVCGGATFSSDTPAVPCEPGSSCLKRTSAIWQCIPNSQLPKGTKPDADLKPASDKAGPDSAVLLPAKMACSKSGQCASGSCPWFGHTNPNHNQQCAECSKDEQCGTDGYCNVPGYRMPSCHKFGPKCSKAGDCKSWFEGAARGGFAECDTTQRGGSRCKHISP